MREGNSSAEQGRFLQNNFDLVRLLAAFQVALVHVVRIMEIDLGWIGSIIMQFVYLFPGVPIFFFISGFLISRSYENNSCLKEFCTNRALRLFPGLIVCVALSIVVVIISGYLDGKGVRWFEVLAMFLAKVTFLQFYNPDFMRAYGDGVLNGSLWTITVEIQFYLLTPVIFLVIARDQMLRSVNIKLLAVLIIFFLCNRLYVLVPNMVADQRVTKLIGVSFVPWLYIYLLGVIVQKNFDWFYGFLAGRFYIVFPCYLVAAYLFRNVGDSFGNNMNPVLVVLLVLTIIALAYSWPSMSMRLLKGNDISYGVYIYHMPVVNLMIFCGLYREFTFGCMALGACLLLAALSWQCVEGPSLRLKRHPLISSVINR